MACDTLVARIAQLNATQRGDNCNSCGVALPTYRQKEAKRRKIAK